MLVLLTLITIVQATPSLSFVDGACPGPARIEATDLTPGGTAWFFVGLTRADDLIATGPCAGMATGLGGELLVATAAANDAGMIRAEPTLPGAACERVLQVIDAATCEGSNVVDLDAPTMIPDGPACAYDPEAEHPGYTTIATDVALCGNTYGADNIAEACGPGWHVCEESEWEARFPSEAPPLGPTSTFGDDQSVRCTASVWIAGAPDSGDVWGGEVCDDPYNPWNSYKCLYADGGDRIRFGSGSCCSWDRHGGWSDYSSGGCAVYCCAD